MRSCAARSTPSKTCLAEAFKLARSIILHPSQLEGVASLLSSPQPAPPKVAAAIRHVLATEQLRLYIDLGCHNQLFGHHIRPGQFDDPVQADAIRKTIFIGDFVRAALTHPMDFWIFG